MLLKGSLLEHPIPADTRERIIAQLWNQTKIQSQHFRAYFEYYTEQCRIAFQSQGGKLPVRDHQGIIDVAADISGCLPRSTVKNNIISRCNQSEGSISDESLNACIDLAARLLFMLDVGEFRNAYSGRRKLIWMDTDIPMQAYVENIFTEKSVLDHTGLKLGGLFNARNLARIAGFKVELTTNLADHLRLRDSDGVVTIFHHASFLMSQRQTSLFPARFVDETLLTLALLFPKGDRATKKWYSKLDEPEELDCNVLDCRPLNSGSAIRQLDEYKYWHDRLVILKEAFDESRPSTVLQWWNDRRDGVQWYTLWVAISLSVFFGLVQSIEGALQVYKAYYP